VEHKKKKISASMWLNATVFAPKRMPTVDCSFLHRQGSANMRQWKFIPHAHIQLAA